MSIQKSFKINTSVVFLLIASFVLLMSFDTIIFNSNSNPATEIDFINYETPHCHPIDITPDGQKLLAVNIANYSLEVFDIVQDDLVHSASISVGIDPVTVRVKSNTEAWVINTISDNISIVDLTTNLVVKTIQVPNEPWDVVFAGNPLKAYVSSAEPSILSIFDLNNLDLAPLEFKVIGEDLRALSVSNNGLTVYGAFFESGNQSTVVNGNLGSETNMFAPDIDSEINLGPYGSVKVPPNDGNNFNPPLGPAGLPPHPKSLPVKKSSNGLWLDDNGEDWSNVISGGAGKRVNGWDLPDRDIVVFDTDLNKVSYQKHMGNILMAMEVNPSSDEVFVVGTDGTNEIRFEPVINGKFLRVNVSKFSQNAASQIIDLNTHLDYQNSSIPPIDRLKSIGDPRGIAWLSNGNKAYITGMGSNNMITIDENGNRTSTAPISLGEGPTGLVINNTDTRAYVLNKFEGSISIVNLQSDAEINKVTFFDPTPLKIKNGRKFLYDTHFGSGTGHISCASCHIDAKYDRLGWDLSNPSGEMEGIPSTVVNFNFGNPNEQFHPLKGLMVTTSLIDIINPSTLLHWRGDRSTLNQFASAYVHLQGRDTEPSDAEMQDFSDFIASIHFAPNPNRNLDNSFSTNMELPSPYDQTPLIGDAAQGLHDYLTTGGAQQCLTCHEPNTGRGDETRLTLTPHRMPSGFRGNYDQTGFWKFSPDGSTSGFGFFSDGSLDSRFKFFEGDFGTTGLDALVYSFEGSDLGADPDDVIHFSQDSHAATGKQVTVNGPYLGNQEAKLAELKSIVDQSDRVSFVVTSLMQSEIRNFYYDNNNYQSDKSQETYTHTDLLNNALSGNPTTWTVVFDQVKIRTSVDKNSNNILDREELIANFIYQREEPYDIPAITSFDASSTFQPLNNALDYQWDFGDGNTGNGEFPNHTFASPGDYLVRLIVHDQIANIVDTFESLIEIIPGCVGIVGSACTDPCYSSGVVLPDCSCSGNLIPDSDLDGLCDSIDSCPGFDNNIIGLPCDDNDPCTDSDVWQNTCDCRGIVADLDNDNICDYYDLDDDNDGILDAVELDCDFSNTTINNIVTTVGSQKVDGTYNNQSAAGTFSIDLSDASLALSTSSQFDGNGISYAYRDLNENFSSTINIDPANNSLIDKILWGPDLLNINNSLYDNNSQNLTLNWNLEIQAMVFDPDNQLTIPHESIISSGATITQTSNLNNGTGTWFIEWILNVSNESFELIIDQSDGSDLSFEGFSLMIYSCSSIDTDQDGILNHLDFDSDGDLCLDAIEGANNYNYDQIANNSLMGDVDSDGVPVIVGSGGQEVGNGLDSLITSDNCCFIDFTLNVTDQIIFQQNDGFANLVNINGGNPPYTILWSNGVSGDSNTGLAPGDYNVVVTDGIGCSQLAEFEIVEVDCSSLDLTLTSTNETGFNSSDGAISTSLFGGFPPYFFNWSNGESSTNLTDLTPGFYYVTVVDSKECPMIDSIEIFEFDCSYFSANLVVADESYFETNDGAASMTLTGDEPFSYLWSTGETTADIDNLSPGDYSVTVSDVNNCELVESFTIQSIDCTNSSLQISNTNVSSFNGNDGTIATVVTGNAPFQYNWSTGATTADITDLNPGTYYLTVLDNIGCQMNDSAVVQNFNCLAFTYDLDVTDESIHEGSDGSASINFISGNGPYQYLWSTGETSSEILNLAPGDYQFTVTDNNNCSQNGVFVINPAPAAHITSFVYNDINANGFFDFGDQGLENIDIQISESNGDISTVTTDADGNWFSTVRPGLTLVEILNNQSLLIGSTVTEGDNPSLIIASLGDTIQAENDGFSFSNQLCGKVFYDSNNNATHDFGESLLPNIEIIITDVTGAVHYTTTDNNGSYCVNVVSGLTDILVDDSDPEFPSGAIITSGQNPQTLDFQGNNMTALDMGFKRSLNFDLKVYLEGALSIGGGIQTYDTIMRVDLNDLHTLPGQFYIGGLFSDVYFPPGQPYSASPWNYDGTEGDYFDSNGNAQNGDANYPIDIVDWLLVSLRTTIYPDSEVCKAATLLKKTGEVVFVEDFNCDNLENSFYVVIEHRNHLMIMSETEIPAIDGSINYDFTQNQTFVDAFGLSVGQKVIIDLEGENQYVMIGGNGEQTDSNSAPTDVNVNDKITWENSNNSFPVYIEGDFDLSADTNVNDKFIWDKNNNSFSSVPR